MNPFHDVKKIERKLTGFMSYTDTETRPGSSGTPSSAVAFTVPLQRKSKEKK